MIVEVAVLVGAFVRQIKSLMAKIWVVKVSYIYREANKSADMLTILGCDLGSPLIFYECPPVLVSQVLLSKIIGVSPV